MSRNQTKSERIEELQGFQRITLMVSRIALVVGLVILTIAALAWLGAWTREWEWILVAFPALFTAGMLYLASSIIHDLIEDIEGRSPKPGSPEYLEEFRKGQQALTWLMYGTYGFAIALFVVGAILWILWPERDLGAMILSLSIIGFPTGMTAQLARRNHKSSHEKE